MEGLGGLFDLILVLAFVAGWGVLELVGKRLDKRKEAERRLAAEREASEQAAAAAGDSNGRRNE